MKVNNFDELTHVNQDDEMKLFREAFKGLPDDAEELDPYQHLYEISFFDPETYGALKKIISSIHEPMMFKYLKQEKQKLTACK